MQKCLFVGQKHFIWAECRDKQLVKWTVLCTKTGWVSAEKLMQNIDHVFDGNWLPNLQQCFLMYSIKLSELFRHWFSVGYVKGEKKEFFGEPNAQRKSSFLHGDLSISKLFKYFSEFLPHLRATEQHLITYWDTSSKYWTELIVGQRMVYTGRLFSSLVWMMVQFYKSLLIRSVNLFCHINLMNTCSLTKLLSMNKLILPLFSLVCVSSRLTLIFLSILFFQLCEYTRFQVILVSVQILPPERNKTFTSWFSFFSFSFFFIFFE